ncbi:hypothetical protein RN001_005798 [Aquatica leii]|uniref:DDE Tnp4 domain-containing protein n=1 Tax=Aquatica leii TaxID=1421715 RepID=A0AAN7SJ66_9COLE|nr:hypothetical protein RN001_005798 [Aquatica leii]
MVCSSNTRLYSRNKVVLTLMKLKLNVSLNSLGVLFRVSSKAARSYFYDTLQQLSAILKPLIRFPPKEEILSNIPLCFDKYRSTRLILDCTEINIEKSNCLKCRINSYSYYKKNNTIKYLIGYGGRVSDKAIFNAEHVIDKVDPGDGIMVDKAFLRKSKQFSKEDAIKTTSIARARVHVEQAIQRIKTFKVCKGTVLWTLLPYMDDIIVGLTNLGQPILADNKFHT